ncbi:MAG: SLBB domain-containing protein, partial [Candidatus Tectimicrobiota bacterium]
MHREDSVRLYRVFTFGCLWISCVLGLVSFSRAQQPPALPGVPGSAGSAPLPSSLAPGREISTRPAAPTTPGVRPALPTAPAPAGTRVPGAATPGAVPSAILSGAPLRLPATSTPSPAAGRPAITPEQTPRPSGLPDAVNSDLQPALPPAAEEELSPIERLIAGDSIDPNSLLRQFGYDLFKGPPTTFAPVTDVPVGPDYVIGPGDSLNILLWGGIQDSYQVEVDRNGTIALPRLGAVQVWGLTLDQMQRLLQKRFSEFYPDFHMAVTLGRLRTNLVYVVGEVKQPGAYTVSSLSTIINALFASGGPTKNGSLRRIQLIRQGRVIHTLDLYSFLIQGDKSQDQMVQSGDTILVPLIGHTAGVAGNVKRPAIYELGARATLRGFIELAGGVTPLGYLQRVQVERSVANQKRVVVDFDLHTRQPRGASGDVWQTPILDGDLVRVFSIITSLTNSVRLEGHVLRPGNYELKPGMRLRDLLPSYEQVLQEPYLDYAEIVRYVGPDLRRTIRPFNLGALLAGDPAQNVPLHPEDIVRVFPKADFVDPPEVRISGLVHRPGIYPLTDAMRVKDLVLRAGNVLKFAYLERAELTRRSPGQFGEQAIRIEIQLSKALEDVPEHNLFLQDFDHLVVRQIPDITLQQDVALQDEGLATRVYPLVNNDDRAIAALQRTGKFIEQVVEIQGEVRFPGVYPILKGERLSSALQRAGGYSAGAYLRGAVFTRQSVKAEQEKRLQELLREEETSFLAASTSGALGSLNPEDVQAQRLVLESRRQLLERLRTFQPDGRLVVRLQPLDSFTGSPQDIELRTGDRLVIPDTPQYINILGEVYNRTSLIYEPERPISYYLEKVGGLKPEADEDQLYLVQLDGTVLSSSQNQFSVLLANGKTRQYKDFFRIQPQPGDSIIVPRRAPAAPAIRNVRDIVQILFQSVSVLGVISLLA